jgi:hypothetical protein
MSCVQCPLVKKFHAWYVQRTWRRHSTTIRHFIQCPVHQRPTILTVCTALGRRRRGRHRRILTCALFPQAAVRLISHIDWAGDVMGAEDLRWQTRRQLTVPHVPCRQTRACLQLLNTPDESHVGQ